MIPTSYTYTRNMKNQYRERSVFFVEIERANLEAQDDAQVTYSYGVASAPDTILGDSIDTEIRYALVYDQLRLSENLFIYDSASSNTYSTGVMFMVGRGRRRYITISFSQDTYIDYITLFFGELLPWYVEILTLDNKVISGHDVASEREEFEIKQSIKGFKVYMASVNQNYQMFKLAGITLGKIVTFDNESIEKLSSINEIDEISENLPETTLTVNLIGQEGDFDCDNPDNVLTGLEYGQVIRLSLRQFFDTGTYEDVVLNNCLKLSGWQFGRTGAVITAQGRIAQMTSYFTHARIGSHSVYDLITDVFDEIGLIGKDRYIDESLKNIFCENPLPYVSCAQALQLLANLGLCAIRHGYDGMISVIRIGTGAPVYSLNYDDMWERPYGTKGDLIKDISVQMTKYAKRADEELIFEETVYTPIPEDGYLHTFDKTFFSEDVIDYTRYVVTYAHPINGSATHETQITADLCRRVDVKYWGLSGDAESDRKVILQVYGYRYDISSEYYKETFERSGISRQWNNPLVSNEDQARNIAQWIRNSSLNAVDYDIEYRGEPVLETGDVIQQENLYIPQLQTKVIRNAITFSGGSISGDMVTRRN